MVVRDLSKSYGSIEVISGLNMHVDPGEIICIVGPSGVGKTTLLRSLSGLMPPTSGSVSVGGKVITQPLEEIGIVFQDYRGSLMPWMRTLENVAFPLQGRGIGKAEREQRAQECLDTVGLSDAGQKYPWELSGGMQQRVAIARALAYDAHILLMDEPFGSLDAQTRLGLEDLVLDLRSRLKISVIVVTHDIDEAVYLADRVVVLAGKPASVVDNVDVDLGMNRDQIKTKSDPRFVEYRNRVLSEIMRVRD
ncbi:ABC transporter ATP-binding protein [Rhizobium sp. L1K21]|uniref:ABC transporter ATP-binding protein n=1 Tax=Rhizobium sp. L1K21 TaxID=2954933 RepID=UPI002092DB7C|nr:ABC transporter ATP-binding protein [Rhizobium sp. L1K21]MCO6187591.1 ABC transporter ATP-binding protein [Rhizobium sp. L1K21]